MRYIIPYYSPVEDEINSMTDVQGRLRAFPTRRKDFKMYSKEKYPYKINFPAHVQKILLNSAGFSMPTISDKDYMLALEQYYFYNADERCICVAPDAFLNPVKTMYNFKKWLLLTNNAKVAAVLQADTRHTMNVKDLMKQAEFYRKYTDIIFFANPLLTAENAKYLKVENLFKFLKQDLEVKYIHVLGAGWTLEEIKGWKSIAHFDSMDSISYYSTKDVAAFGSLDPIENIKNIMKVMNSDASI